MKHLLKITTFFLMVVLLLCTIFSIYKWFTCEGYNVNKPIYFGLGCIYLGLVFKNLDN